MGIEFAIILIVFFGFMFVGMPVFLAMGISGLLGLYLMQGSVAITTVELVAYRGADSFVLIAVPLFVFCGTLMEESGTSSRLYNFAKAWVGDMPNGLGVAVVLSCAIFAAISGSSVATAATIGLVALPLLALQGYSGKARGSLLAAGGTLGILIPPSISMILIGNIIEESVGKLFMAGFLPGIVLSLLIIFYLVVISRPKIKGIGSSLKEKVISLKNSILVLLLPVGILGGIYTGLATPTEVAALACIYCLIVGFLVLRTLNFRNLMRACENALLTTVMIMMIVCFGKVLSQYFTIVQIPQTLAALVSGIEAPTVVIITAILGIYLVLGCFMEAVSMVLVTVPVFFPIAVAVGISPLYFGVFVTLAMELAQITPPVGINLYVVSGVGKIPIEEMVRGIIPYIIAMVITIYLVWFFPALYAFIPGTMH